MKQCTKCHHQKDLSSFYKDRQKADGLSSHCKACSRLKQKKYVDNPENATKLVDRKQEYYLENRDAIIKRTSSYQKLNPEQRRLSGRKAHLKKYGLTIADYERMHQSQGGRCAICKRQQVDLNFLLSVDHSHATGTVRKLLCKNCNSILGLARESEEVLLAAIEYLREHKDK